MVAGDDVAAPEKVADYDTCSTNCYKNDDCEFWSFNSRYECLMKKENDSSNAIREVDELYVYYGKKNCFGKSNLI